MTHTMVTTKVKSEGGLGYWSIWQTMANNKMVMVFFWWRKWPVVSHHSMMMMISVWDDRPFIDKSRHLRQCWGETIHYTAWLVMLMFFCDNPSYITDRRARSKGSGKVRRPGSVTTNRERERGRERERKVANVLREKHPPPSTTTTQQRHCLNIARRSNYGQSRM